MAKIPDKKKKPETLDDIAKDAVSGAPPSNDELQHVSVRLHPDLVRRIKKYAESEHRMFSETVRDLLLTGMRERGI